MKLIHLLAGFGENELGRDGLLAASELLDGVVPILLVVGQNAEYHLFVSRHFANLAEILRSSLRIDKIRVRRM